MIKRGFMLNGYEQVKHLFCLWYCISGLVILYNYRPAFNISIKLHVI